MVAEEGVFKFLVENGYLFFISEYGFYEDLVLKAGGNFIKTINTKTACNISIGMRLAGICSLVIVKDSVEDFSYINERLCNEYGMYMVGLCNVCKEKALNQLLLSEGYEKKLLRRLKDVDENKKSLLVVLEEKDVEQGSN